MKSLITLAALSAGLVISTPSQATTYTAHAVVGPTPVWSQPDSNGSTVIVGYEGRAVGTGINASGSAVGFVGGGAYPDSTWGTEPYTGQAYAINSSGQAAGFTLWNGPDHAILSSPKGVSDLGTWMNGYDSHAYGINDSGQVVGYSSGDPYPDQPGFAQHAFITAANGNGMSDLGTLGGSSSEAYGVNTSGQVVGYSYTAGNVQHAFITRANGIGMTDLGTLGGGISWAYGINASGQVVGYSYTAGNVQHAFITGANGIGMTDLNSLVNLGGGDYFYDARGVNDSGQIIANSVQGYAYLLTPVPEADCWAMMLAGLSLIGGAVRRQRLSLA